MKKKAKITKKVCRKIAYVLMYGNSFFKLNSILNVEMTYGVKVPF